MEISAGFRPEQVEAGLASQAMRKDAPQRKAQSTLVLQA